MLKKGGSNFVILGGFVMVLIIEIGAILYLVSLSTAQGDISRKQQQTMDADMAIQGIRQTFEKTAAYFGLMLTAKELGTHGGVSNAATVAGDILTPKLSSAENIAYWAVARCNNTAGEPTSYVRTRIPFVSYKDYNMNIDTSKVRMLLIDASEYTQEMEDVKDGKYKFDTLVQVFILRKGTVTANICQGASCIAAPLVMDKSGMFRVSFGSEVVKDTSTDIYLEIWGNPA